jgi:hypothetical protein
MRPSTTRAATGLVLAALLCLGGTGTWAQGRQKPVPKPVPAPVELPDASPGSVVEVAYTEDVEGAIIHRLGFLVNVYAQGMQGYIADAARDLRAGVSELSLRSFRDQLLRATLAFFEYSWDIDGVRHTRIYVSRSNRDFDRYIPRSASDLVAPGTSEADYLPDTGVFRFARTGVVVPGSAVLPSEDPTANRANDAEIKILQTLKRDIRLDPAMTGGELVGFVSQRPCISCSPALRRFASETGTTVRINYIGGQNPDGSSPPLYRQLRQIREVSASLLLMHFIPGS